MTENDKLALDRSLADACKCARRLSRLANSEAHDVAMAFVRALRRLGAEDAEQ